jgi:hypothetical protein
MEAMEDRMESLTQKRSHGSSDKEHPVLFDPPEGTLKGALTFIKALYTG